MAEQDIAPIDHSTLGATASTAAGVAGGALSGGWGGFWKGIMVLALIGGAIGLIYGLGAAGLLSFAAGTTAKVVIPAIVGQLGQAALWAGIGTALGGIVGVAAGWITVPVGGIFGAFSGGKKAAAQVSQERAAAMEMQMQMAASMPQPAGPQINNSAYQITPEEYVLMQSRMRGGEGQRADHVQAIQSERAAAELAPDQRV